MGRYWSEKLSILLTVAICANVAGANPASVGNDPSWQDLTRLEMTAQKQKKWREAEVYGIRACQQAAKRFGSVSSQYWSARNYLADAKEAAGQFKDAEAIRREQVSLEKKVSGSSTTSESLLIHNFDLQERYADAISLRRDLIATREREASQAKSDARLIFLPMCRTCIFGKLGITKSLETQCVLPRRKLVLRKSSFGVQTSPLTQAGQNTDDLSCRKRSNSLG